jgi:hypothetical protein
MFGKIQIFEKVRKNSEKTAEEKLVFSHFLNSWVPKKRRKGRYSQKYEKKVKITAP